MPNQKKKIKFDESIQIVERIKSSKIFEGDSIVFKYIDDFWEKKSIQNW